MSFEEQLQYLQDKTHINENVIGCYLSNYKNKYICSGFHSCGCKYLAQCQLLQRLHDTHSINAKRGKR